MVRINAYLATLLITIVGAGAVLLITHVANAVENNADAITSVYDGVSY